jgi:hypothetical protein
VAVRSELHQLKQYLQRTVTEAGIQMDASAVQNEKALSSIRWSVDPDSNVTVEINSQKVKHDLQRIATEAGIQIDFSDGQNEKASSSIR